ncbi:unnamed protein product [Spirodela intermedia]|uniref:protein-serine/threonine phosphatase n=1 Tax=Spirodela intermedia TaxID=51605 RepID=A0A7I8I8U9_SPIIN|nr:unnamed protein product [Spirodela intermedia]CAA6653914.1 unnamed protein product [Spirodela intermedia]
MVAEAEVFHQSLPALEVQYRRKAKEVAVAATATATAAPPVILEEVSAAAEVEVLAVAADLASTTAAEFVPFIRSGSFADVGPRRYMEDEHIRIDDLAAHMGSIFRCPTPSAFYGVFDGHGGADAAEYVRKHAVRLFFEDVDFPQASQADERFLEEVASSVRRAFLLADDALAEDCAVSRSSGTTALTALVFGRELLVANAGDCRAMSLDHRPVRAAERRRVEECGGYVDDGYLNGVLSVTRALGDWDMKKPTRGRRRRPELTEDDEFLIIGCDGIWDVMTSEHAVAVVRRGLRRHDDPEKSARDLVMEALQLKTFDNLTVIVICFSAEHRERPAAAAAAGGGGRLKYCSLSAEALCQLKSWIYDGGSGEGRKGEEEGGPSAPSSAAIFLPFVLAVRCEFLCVHTTTGLYPVRPLFLSVLLASFLSLSLSKTGAILEPIVGTQTLCLSLEQWQ